MELKCGAVCVLVSSDASLLQQSWPQKGFAEGREGKVKSSMIWNSSSVVDSVR